MKNTKNKLALGACVLALAALIGTAHAEMSQNAILSNALISNAMSNNALMNNALMNNAMSNNAIIANGLEPNAALAQGQVAASAVGAYTPTPSWGLTAMSAQPPARDVR
jgi:hypothetical protein